MYSPKLDEDIVQQLYHIGQHLKRPMTTVVNGVLRFVLKHYDIEFKDGHIDLVRKPDLFEPPGET